MSDLSSITNGSRVSYKNHIRLTMGDYPNVFRPTSVSVSNITPHTATVTWEGSVSKWNLQYKAKGEESWTNIDGLTEATYNLTDLLEDSTYTVRIQTVGNGDEVSLWKSTTFRTLEVCPTPTDFACTSFTATTATLSWTENGAATAWQICLNDDEENLIAADSNPFTVTGLTEDVIYSIKARAVHDGLHSKWCSGVTVQPTDKRFVGTDEGTRYTNPMVFYRYNTLSQQIYQPSELGEAGEIVSIDFKCTKNTEIARTFDVYMVQTDKTYFSGNSDWISVTEADKVYSGSLRFREGWNTIPLDGGFDYDGTRGVAIIVDDNTGQAEINVLCSAYQTNNPEAITIYDNDTDYDPTYPADYYGDRLWWKNYLRVGFNVENGCSKPATLVASDITSRSATLTWTGGDGTYNVEYRSATDTEWTRAATATSDLSCALIGLSETTRYTARVQSVNGSEVSGWRIVNFTTPETVPTPTEVICAATTGTSATLSWTENGTATAWQICIDDDEDNLIAADSNPFTIPGMTEGTTYTAKIRAVNTEGNSRWSDAISFEVTAKKRIGTGEGTDNGNELPVTTRYKYSVSQQIYTAAELGGEAKSIESIDFYLTSYSYGYTQQWDIYLAHTNKNYFTSSSDWISISADDMVYSGSVDCNQPGWISITFDTPFEYNGTDNVVLVVDNNTGISYGNSYYWTYGDTDYCSLIHWLSSNATDFDPTNMSGMSGGLRQNKNQIRLMMNDPSPVPKPATFKATTVYAHKAWLSWTEKGTASQWHICVNENEDSLIDVTANPYLISGLSPETSYTVKVRAVNSEQVSNWAGPISFTTTANPAPGYLETEVVGPYTAELSWYDSGDAETWQICVDGDEDNLIEATEETYTLTGLTPETEYTVKVRGVITGETCPWSDELTFTTTEINPVPIDVSVTPKHTEASVRWTGFSDSYNVRYREGAGIDPLFEESFENGIGGWTLRDCEESSDLYSDAARSGNTGFAFCYNDNPPQYLISPELSGITDGMVLQFYYKNYSSGYPETFQVGFSSTTNETDAFTFGDEITASDEAWHLYQVPIPADTKYVCGKYTSNDQYFLFIDDIAVGTPTEPEEWQIINSNESSATLTGLTAGTTYELQVQGIVDESASDWSNTETFTTVSSDIKIFITDGNWDEANNWEPAGVPTATDDVVIMAAASIPSGVTAWARNITISGMEQAGGGGGYAPAMIPSATRLLSIASIPSITLKDGGQLRHATEGLPVLLEKNITGFGDNPRSGYHLLASPSTDYPTDVDGMTDGDYDLYSFTEDPADGLEWRNYEAQPFWLYSNNETGFLYANSADKVLTFYGESNATNSGSTWYSIVSVINPKSAFTSGWRIFSNTAVADAYVDFGDIYDDDDNNFVPASCNFYKMNAAGDGFDCYPNYVKVSPGEAVFVETDTTGRLRWSYDPLYDDSPVADGTTYHIPYLPQHGRALHQDANLISFIDDADNADVIDSLLGTTCHVMLSGRTFWKDDTWNTLCMPFALNDLTGTPLQGATLRRLDTSTSNYNGTTGLLTLNFTDATSVEAGVPYIFKWSSGENVSNPVFESVTLSSSTPATDVVTTDGLVQMLGNYSPTPLITNTSANLFMGPDNMLYYPNVDDFYVNSFRAYFLVNIGNGLGIANPSSQGVRSFAFDFGEGSTVTGIGKGVSSTDNNKLNDWYTIDGRRLNSKPTQRGVYIVNGKKVIIK